MARHMVCDWGMSPLGPIAYGENQDTVFLGRDITRNEHISPDSANLIDAEVKKIIDDQYERTTNLMTEHRAALDSIAEALMEYETIEGKHVREIVEHGSLQTTVISSLPPEPEKEEAQSEEKEDKPEPESDIGGAGNPAPSPA
jgi:cell division protease FtsH